MKLWINIFAVFALMFFAAPLSQAVKASPYKNGIILCQMMGEEDVHNCAKTLARNKMKIRKSYTRLTVEAPNGAKQFCKNYPAQCKFKVSRQSELTDDQWYIVQKVNRDVNKAIKPTSDSRYYNGEHWSIDSDQGDCDEYALRKRHELINSGIPQNKIKIAVVKGGPLRQGERHAITTVKFKGIWYALDNKIKTVIPVKNTGYVMIKHSNRSLTRWYLGDL